MAARTAALMIALAAVACTGADDGRDRRAEVERRVAEAEGGAAAAGRAERPAPRPPLAIAREPTPDPPAVVEPASPGVTVWAAAIARDLDTLDRRSRQLLTVQRLRETHDPLQKSLELTAGMQWCDEGALESCLHVGHVLVFNECLFDRGRGFYEKAAALASALAAPAVDHFTVDGTPQRQELRAGLHFSDPANRDDQQVRGVAAVCGAIAERDRPWWDAMFARYAAGETTPAAVPASGHERLMLGMLRRKMLFDAEERISSLESLHADTARDLRARLASAANDLCADSDALSCATASFLHARQCRLPDAEDAYRRYQLVLDGLDAAARAQAVEAARDVVAPARVLVEGDAQQRDFMLRSLCAGRSR